LKINEGEIKENRPALNVGSTIPWAESLDGIEGDEGKAWSSLSLCFLAAMM
jgi:hypothetical protein